MKQSWMALVGVVKEAHCREMVGSILTGLELYFNLNNTIPYLRCRASRWYQDRRYRMKQSGVIAVKRL